MAWICFVETVMLMISGAVIGDLLGLCYDQQQRLGRPAAIRECEQLLLAARAAENREV